MSSNDANDVDNVHSRHTPIYRTRNETVVTVSRELFGNCRLEAAPHKELAWVPNILDKATRNPRSRT